MDILIGVQDIKEEGFFTKLTCLKQLDIIQNYIHEQ